MTLQRIIDFSLFFNFHIRKSYAMQLLFFIVKLLSSDLNRSNCRIPWHIDQLINCVTENSGYSVRSAK